MKALIAFIVMAVGILALIEINERIKKKRNRDTGVPESRDPKNCTDTEDCSGCGLIDACEKKSRNQ